MVVKSYDYVFLYLCKFGEVCMLVNRVLNFVWNANSQKSDQITTILEQFINQLISFDQWFCSKIELDIFCLFVKTI